jgi:hypothetical protein
MQVGELIKVRTALNRAACAAKSIKKAYFNQQKPGKIPSVTPKFDTNYQCSFNHRTENFLQVQ